MAGEQFLEMLRNLLARGPSEEDLRYQDEVIREASTGPFGGDYNANLGTVYEALLRPPGETFDPVQRRSSPGETIATHFPGRPEGSLQNIGTEMVMGALEPDPTSLAKSFGVGLPALMKMAGQLINKGKYVSEAADVIGDFGRAGNRQGLRIFRSEGPQGAGPVRGDRMGAELTTPRETYWSTQDRRAGIYGEIYDDLNPDNASRSRVVEAELPLDPDRVLDVTDDVAIRQGANSGRGAPSTFISWAEELPYREDLDSGTRTRIQSTLDEWRDQTIDSKQLLEDLRAELGTDIVAEELRESGMSGLLQYAEDNMEPSPWEREVIVFDRNALRSTNVNNVNEMSQVLDMVRRLSGGR